MVTVPDPTTLPVPPGYQFRFEVTGAAAPGFADDLEQTVLVYARGRQDLSYPLTVAFSHREDVALIGTHGRDGTVVRLPSGADAIYHDGLFELVDETELRWSDTDAHSITVSQPGLGTVAVRGARTRGASFGHLLRVAAQLIV